MGITRRFYDWLGNRLDSSDSQSYDLMCDVGELAFTKAAFEISIGYIAAAIGKAPVVFYEQSASGGVARNDGGWNAYVWNVSPNRNVEADIFKADIIRRMYTTGRAVVVPVNPSVYLVDGSPEPMHHAFADDTYTGMSVDGFRTPQRDYRAGDLFVFDAPDPSVLSVVNSMKETYGRMLSTAAVVFEEHGGRKYKLKLSSLKGTPAGSNDSMQEYVDTQLRKFMSESNAVLPEPNGYDLQPFYSQIPTAGMSSDFISLRKDCFESVASALKMPVSMIYGNTNNFSEVFRSFMTFGVEPVARAIEHELSRKIYGYSGYAAGSHVKVDLTAVKYTDLFDAATDADKLVSSSLLSPNDTLKYLGLDPIDSDWADGHFLTKNYAPADGAQTMEGGER